MILAIALTLLSPQERRLNLYSHIEARCYPTSEIRSLTGHEADVSESTARSDLQALADTGLIEKRGTSKVTWCRQ